MNKQSGNVLLWLVLGIVAIGLGGVIVWRYFAATDSVDNALQAERQSSVTPSSDTVVSRTTVSEWGVSFGIPISLKDKGVTVDYQAPTNDKPDAVYYRSTKLAEANNTCVSETEGKSYDQPFLIISRGDENTEGERNLAGVTEKDVVQVGQKYYFVSTANIKNCFALQVVSPFITDQTRQAVVNSIKAAE